MCCNKFIIYLIKKYFILIFLGLFDGITLKLIGFFFLIIFKNSTPFFVHRLTFLFLWIGLLCKMENFMQKNIFTLSLLCIEIMNLFYF